MCAACCAVEQQRLCMGVGVGLWVAACVCVLRRSSNSCCMSVACVSGTPRHVSLIRGTKEMINPVQFTCMSSLWFSSGCHWVAHLDLRRVPDRTPARRDPAAEEADLVGTQRKGRCLLMPLRQPTAVTQGKGTALDKNSSEEADLVQRGCRRDLGAADLRQHRVLGHCGAAHEVVDQPAVHGREP